MPERKRGCGPRPGSASASPQLGRGVSGQGREEGGVHVEPLRGGVVRQQNVLRGGRESVRGGVSAKTTNGRSTSRGVTVEEAANLKPTTTHELIFDADDLWAGEKASNRFLSAERPAGRGDAVERLGRRGDDDVSSGGPTRTGHVLVELELGANVLSEEGELLAREAVARLPLLLEAGRLACGRGGGEGGEGEGRRRRWWLVI